MPNVPNQSPWPVPTWMKAGGSIVALGQLLAIAIYALAARSGPWPAPMPPFVDTQIGPQFARSISSVLYPTYLKPLHMTLDYHFASNRTGMNTVTFEVRLKDERGEVFNTLKFPDDKANAWVRHRQSILARGLGDDQPVQPTGPIKIAAVGRDAEKIDLWKLKQPGELELVEVDKNAPRESNVMRPSDLSKELAQSYMRYLCREHNAYSAELIRLHRDPIMPFFWFMPSPNLPPAESFLTTKSYFGEYRRDK